MVLTAVEIPHVNLIFAERKEVSLNEFLMGRITLRGENVSIHRAHSHRCIHTHTHMYALVLIFCHCCR